MTKLLYIGDPHVTADDLADCEHLIDLIVQVQRETGATPVLLGDQHHNHALLHLEVMGFWRRAFARMCAEVQPDTSIPIVLVGNHDRPGEPSSSVHAMMAYEGLGQLWVIDKPQTIDGVRFVPYCFTQEEFVEAARDPNSTTLVCHQTFDGSQFENGFFARDGINPNLLSQKEIISGHIHAPQQVGKVWYPGAPRWRISTDANTERAIWVVTHAEDGTIVDKKSYDTGEACRKIIQLEYTPDGPLLPKYLDPRHDWRIDVRGPAEWVERAAEQLAHPSVRIRTFKLEASVPKVRESDGVDVAFQKYWKTYDPRYGTDRSVLAEMVKERFGVQATA